jgi:hypothetical protein
MRPRYVTSEYRWPLSGLAQLRRQPRFDRIGPFTKMDIGIYAI